MGQATNAIGQCFQLTPIEVEVRGQFIGICDLKQSEQRLASQCLCVLMIHFFPDGRLYMQDPKGF